MHADQAIRARRTVKAYEPSDLPRSVIEELLELAILAPNHRHTEPWRFTVARGSALAGRVAPAAQAAFDRLGKEGDEASRARLERKRGGMDARIRNAAALIFVTCVPDARPAVDLENYAACACAVQNLMVAAAARGLASFWSTGRILKGPEVQAATGFDPKHRYVGAIFLGRGDAGMPQQRQSLSDVARFLDDEG
ncbi:MAG: nitroreductase family protein [Planctomycetota bacterium]